MNKKLRCFQEVLDVSALEEAARSSERWAQGVPLGMFDGVPFAVKDEISVKGTVLGDGLVIDGRQAAEEDDPVVARLRAAGGVLIGKTVMTTFGASPLGWNVDAQGPLNPYNDGHYTGGSSAGSAAAVSAGIVPVAIGLDGGGSIRIPAGFCGVFGLAPTFGRVPFQNLGTSVLSVIKVGPIAADAASLAATYSIIAQPPPHEHPYFQMYGGDGPPPAHTAGFNEISSLAGLRLGIFKPHFEDASPAIVEACHKSVRELENLGATVVEVEIPHMFALSLAHGLIIASEMASMHDEEWWQHSASIWPDTKISLALFRGFKGKEYVSGLRLRAWALRWMREHVFAQVDAYVTPTTGITAPLLSASARPSGESDTVTVMQVMKFIFLGNFLGYPGITVPVGCEEYTSLPISLHLMAEHWNEAVLLRAANALQATITQRLPSNFVSSK